MVLNDTVEIKWNGRNIDYYKQKGYVYTKQGDSFVVSIKDLKETSHIKINVSCDCCGKLGSPSYRDYVKRKYEEYLCSNCASKRQKEEAIIIPKISFAEYNIQKLGADFLKMYWSNKNIIDPYKISYGSETKVWIKCNKTNYHQDYLVECFSFSSGRRCPFCSGKKVDNQDSLGTYIINNFGISFLNKIWSNKNKVSCFDISIQSGKLVWWKCIDKLHTDFLRRVSDMVNYDFTCSNCSYEKEFSRLQNKVNTYIKTKYKYDILHENSCTISPVNNFTGKKLRYDNEIKDLKLIIEVHGSQHYLQSGFIKKYALKRNTSPEYEQKMLQYRDKYKKEYAISKGYYYLELPYWLEENDNYKKFIDDKISLILSKEKNINANN